MSRQASGTGRHWYVIHTYSGYEDAVKEATPIGVVELKKEPLRENAQNPIPPMTRIAAAAINTVAHAGKGERFC